jgi:hypothetical protein
MRSVARFLLHLRTLPRGARLYALQLEIEIRLYQLWCKLRGQEFRYPAFDRKIGVTYRVTKQIPGVSITLFGKQFHLIVPVTLDLVEVNPSDGTPPSDDYNHRVE